jgi:hypothetical protein
VIGIALPEDRICHTFSSLGVTAEKHSDLNHVCSLNLSYRCLSSLTAFHNVINMTLNNAGIRTDWNRPTLPYSPEVIDTLIGFIAQNTHFSLVCLYSRGEVYKV